MLAYILSILSPCKNVWVVLNVLENSNSSHGFVGDINRIGPFAMNKLLMKNKILDL